MLVLDVEGGLYFVDVVVYCIYWLCVLGEGKVVLLVLVGFVLDVLLLVIGGCWLFVL